MVYGDLSLMELFTAGESSSKPDRRPSLVNVGAVGAAELPLMDRAGGCLGSLNPPLISFRLSVAALERISRSRQRNRNHF